MIPSRCVKRGLAMLIIAAAMLPGLSGCSWVAANGSRRLVELPNHEEGMLKVADASRNAGNCSEAMRLYRLTANKATDLAKKSEALLGAADCELDIGNIAAAEHDYRAAIATTPNAGFGYLGLGRAFLIEKQPAEGVHYLELALKRGADFATVWNDMGVALDELGRHGDAQLYYRRGLAKYPSDHALRNNLALSLAMSGNDGEAENIMQVLADEPDATARTRANLALVLGLAGDDDGAREASHADLDNAALDNNSRYYEQIRNALAKTSSNGKVAEKTVVLPSAPAVSASGMPTTVTAISPAQRPVETATSVSNHDRKMASASTRHRHRRQRHVAVRRTKISANHRSVMSHAARSSRDHRRDKINQALATTIR